MSEPSSPDPHAQEATDEPKGGPSNPRGSEAGDSSGLDAPTPPGGPQRQDAAGTGAVPNGREARQYADQDSAQESVQGAGHNGTSGHTIPIEEEESHPERDHPSESDDLQQENAATSLDEPSESLS